MQYVNENKMSDSLYDMSFAEKKDKYAIFFGGNYALIHIMGESGHKNSSDSESIETEAQELLISEGNVKSESIETTNEESVLIIKDSYGNSVVPFLAEHYSNIYMMDLRYYHENVDEFIEAHNVSKIIFIHNVDFISTDNCFLWL